MHSQKGGLNRLRDADCDIGFQVAEAPQPAALGEAPVAVLASTVVREAGAAPLLRLQAQLLGLRECPHACGLRPRYVRLGCCEIPWVEETQLPPARSRG